MRTIYLAFFIFFALIKNMYGQIPTGKEPGKCYAKCKIGQKHDMETEVFAEFLGAKMIAGIEEYTIQTEAEQSAWLAHKITKDSTFYSFLNVDKNKFYIVSDTSLIKNFKMTTIVYKKLRPSAYQIEWREVFCDDKVTPFWAKIINQKLYEHGFDCNKDSAFMSEQTKNALTLFQKYNNLPIGQLNVETMLRLGVKMK